MIFEELNNEQLETTKCFLANNIYNHYRYYPSKFKQGWVNFTIDQISHQNKIREYFFCYDVKKENQLLISIRISKWDEEHFGFKLAMLEFILFDENVKNGNLENSFQEIIEFLNKNNIRFISIRVNGDNLKLIHFLESCGFRYFENVIWPVGDIRDMHIEETNDGIRLATSEDLERIKFIAANFQYQRGHYHCDRRFNINSVNQLYSKWVEQAFNKGNLIIVVEADNIIYGYFIISLDESLSSTLGYKYGRMCSLAIDSAIRGKGVGKKIFTGTINWMKMRGIEYIDSGYSTKNHLSAKLHAGHNMYSVYEEITLHLWL